MTEMPQKANTQPKNFVTHLRTLASMRPDDIWLTVAGTVNGELHEKPISYGVFERRVQFDAHAEPIL